MVAKLITANSNIIHNNKYNIDDNNKTSATTEIINIIRAMRIMLILVWTMRTLARPSQTYDMI